MEESTVSIIGIMIASIIMFIVPLVLMADRNDDISQLTVETLTAEFVDNIIRMGKITSNDYENYMKRLETSGNNYQINMEVKILDKNTAQRTTTGPTTGNNSYYSIYTSQIEDMLQESDRQIGGKNGRIILKEGDIISVTTKNSSKTLSQTLKSIYYSVTGTDLHIIASTSSGTIAVNGKM